MATSELKPFNIANHLIFGYLRQHKIVTDIYTDIDVVDIVLDYIDAKTTKYYPPPIKINQLTQLNTFGIDQNLIESGNVSIAGIEHLVIKENNKISIMNMSTKETSTFNLKVDLMSMNPSKNIIAFATKYNLEFYDINFNTKIDTVHTVDPIKHCQWISDNTITYITNSSIYHCVFSDSGTLKISTYFQQTPDIFCIKDIQIDGKNVTVLFYIKQTESCTQLCANKLSFINDTSNEDKTANIEFKKNDDYIISMIASSIYDCVYLVSKYGMIFIIDANTMTQIYSKEISFNQLISVMPDLKSGGIFIMDSKGDIINVSINCDTVVQYIIYTLDNEQLGIKWSEKFNLCGAENIFQAQFDALIKSSQYNKAAKLAAKAPVNALRTRNTLSILRKKSSKCVHKYYSLLLKKGSLNEYESIGFCKQICKSRIKHVYTKQIEQLFCEEKLTYSEELGDTLSQYTLSLAKQTYQFVGVYEKVILCLIQMGQVDKIILYCATEKYTPNWSELLTQTQQLRRDDVTKFANILVDNGYLSPKQVIYILLNERKDPEKAVEFLLEYFNKCGDREEDSDLQTTLFDICLRNSPHVADEILKWNVHITTKFSVHQQLTHYDRNYIAGLCESAQLYHRAMEHYEDINDIKRMLQLGLATNRLSENFLPIFMANLMSDDILSCFQNVLNYPQTGNNIQLIAKSAARCTQKVTPEQMIALFEKVNCALGIYLYLGDILNGTTDSKLIMKYITVAIEMGNIQQAELVCRENDYYDPEEVKTFLMKKEIDPRPLIHVCHKHGYYVDLAKHLYSRKLYTFIQVYLDKMSANVTPIIIGVILDMNPSYFTILGCVKSESIAHIICEFVFGNETPKHHIQNILDVIRTDRYSIDKLHKELDIRNLSRSFINIRIPIVTLPINIMHTASILIYGYLRETQTIIKTQIHLDIAKIIINHYWIDPFKCAEPIKCQSILQLKQLGVDIEGIKYNATMESDRCIVIRGENEITVVATCVQNNVTTIPNVSVDSAIMNPSSNVLGLRLDHRLQVYNLDIRTRMKATETTDAVLYWRWINSRTIAYVTNKAVYHWSMESYIDVEPVKTFDIVPEDRQVEIIDYDASKDGNWLFLQGIAKSTTDNNIEGVLQLYSVPLNRYQPKMNAHGACFAYLNINGRDATLFCFTKKDGMSTKLFMI
eukprot:315078_1